MSAAAAGRLRDFIAALRQAGLRIDLARHGMLHEALRVIPADGLRAVFLAGRATLCASPDDNARYNACFARFFFGHVATPAEILPNPEAPPVLPAGGDLGRRGGGEQDDDDREIEIGAASPAEILRERKLSTLSDQERILIFALIARLRGNVATYRGRRAGAAASGAVDLRRTIRAAMSHGGDPGALLRARPRPRLRKRVLLLDISGSMAPYAPGLLRFGYAAQRCAPRRTEVFTIGTRLTRVTRAFDNGDAEAAILVASRLLADWSGGTRLGEQLKAFLDNWGQRGMARGAVVVIASDGWEQGGAGLLGAQMRRLAGLAHRIIWANPHKSTPGFEPLTMGMQAALPAIDDFVAGSSVAELERLIRLMGLPGRPRR